MSNGLTTTCLFEVARLRKFTKAFDRVHIDAQAFSQLTRKYLEQEFNPNVPDMEDVRCVYLGTSWPEFVFTKADG